MQRMWQLEKDMALCVVMKRDHLTFATIPGECEFTQGCDWTPGAGSCFQEVSALCQPISHVENSVVNDAFF